jgi:PBSX family phage terminase large subunit
MSRVQKHSFLHSTARINLWHGPVRSGKSIASLLRWIDYVQREAPPGDLFMFGKTAFAFKRNIVGPMTEMLGPDMQWSSGEGVIKLWGRTIHVIGANDERAEQKIRGSTSAGSYGDEIALYPEDFFRMATSRMSVRGAKFFGTTNPDSPTHWLKTNYINRGESGEIDCRSFHWGLDCNPFLDVEYIDAIKREYTGLWKKRFIDGLWVLAEGSIYDMFDEDRHVTSSAPKRPDYYIVGVDYGTGNPTAFILIGVEHRHNKRPRAWAEREYYYDSTKANRQKTDSEYAFDLKMFLGKRAFTRKDVTHVYVDPSAASFKKECQNQGVDQIADADNDVLNGIRTVATMLHQGRYKIHSTCTQTITDYGAYVWDSKKQRKGEDAPVKSNDHTKDAERYALHTHFGEDSILYTEASMRG